MAKKHVNPQQQCLFDAEEMGGITKGDLFEKKDEPVVCLGMTFESEGARREYFRNELRQKMPELRKIEGFPIGTDDDIINLSDPPYYTACPNPWLNDFIAQWEEEKKQLVAEGKRDENKVVTEPYASDVSEGKNNPVYTAHTYHTKVPHPAIMRYILHYTQPGDIVFDGFAGTGMTGVAAQACGNPTSEQRSKIEGEWISLFGTKPNWGERHAICGDLSPYASMISYNYNTPVNAALLEKEVKRIFKEVKDECSWMYTTMHEGKPALINYVVWSDVCVCGNCGEEFVYWNTALDCENKCMRESFECPHCKALQTKKTMSKAFETKYDDFLKDSIPTPKSVPVIVVYTTAEGKRFERDATEYDMEIASKIENIPCNTYFPLMRMPEGGETRRNDKHGITHIHHFYTRRNLLALSCFYDKINKSPLSNKIRFIFTGMINRSTKMNRVHINNFFFGGGGWNAGHMKGTLYVPSAPVETSILEQVEDKLNGYLRAFPMLPQKYGNEMYVSSADDTTMSDNSVDYIFVDPPFGANISYSELNILPEAWLNVVTNNLTEAIENPSQGKNNIFYLEEMQKCFTEFYRILKPGKWMTVEFSNTKSSVWSAIQRAITSSGFIIANVSALDKKQGGMRAIVNSVAVREDLAISCYKPSERLQKILPTATIEEIRIDVWAFVEEHLGHLPVVISRAKSTAAVIERSPNIIYDRLISFFVEKGIPVPIDAKDFQKGLRERYIEKDGMFFTALQAAEYEEKKKAAPEFVPMGIIVSDEANGIEWLKNQLRDSPKTYQEIQPEWMQAINGVRKGDILPELKTILEENFIEMEDGKWRLPNIQDDVDKTLMRTKALLKEFNIYKEQANKAKGKIKEARVEALRAGFKQCYIDKDFQTIVTVGDKIPQNLRDEDEVLLQFYDIALNKI